MTNPLVLEERKKIAKQLSAFRDFPEWFSTFNRICRRLGWCPGCMEDLDLPDMEWCQPCFKSFYIKNKN